VLNLKNISLDVGLLILRLCFAGTMLVAHGLPKLMNFTTHSEKFPGLFGLPPFVAMSLATFAEFFCSALLVAGLLTRLATVPLIITMGVAFFIVHGADPFQAKELSFLYGLSFLTIFFVGPGRISMDRLLFKTF